MKKRILSLVLALATVCTMLPCLPKSVEASSARWEVVNDSSMTGAGIVAEARKWANSGLKYCPSELQIWPDGVAWRTGYGSTLYFDCIGFVSRVLNDCGFRAPSNPTPDGGSQVALYNKYGAGYISSDIRYFMNYGAEDLSSAVAKARNDDFSELQPGDILGWLEGTLPWHVFIYAGYKNGEPWMVEVCGSGYLDRAITDEYKKNLQYGARFISCNHDYSNLGICQNTCKGEYNWQSSFDDSEAGLYEVTLKSGIYLRKDRPYSASTNKSKLIEKGTKVQVLGSVRNHYETDNKWYKVSYNEEVGYTNANNLKEVAHTCDKNGGYQFKEAVHPHKSCYKCSVCGKIWAEDGTSNYYDACSTCQSNSQSDLSSKIVDAPPYPNVEYRYSASVQSGTIRYICQDSDNEQYFFWDYWPTPPHYYYNSPKSECSTACISMALSYVGINTTPYEILMYDHGQTWAKTDWGGTTHNQIGSSESEISEAMDNYINGNGKYSPLVVHINPYPSGGGEHHIVLAGKISKDSYLVIDPWSPETYTLTVSNGNASWGSNTYPIYKVHQWYNPNASMCDHEEYTDLGVCKNPDCKEVYDWQSTYETSSAGLYKVTKLTGIWLRTDMPYEASTKKSKNRIGWGKEVEVLGSVVNKIENGQQLWYKVSYKGEIGYTYAGNLERVSYFPQNIYVAENSFVPADGATIPKASQNLEGKVISTYPLKQIVAYLDGESFAIWNASDNNTYVLELKRSDIDYALAFGDLPSGKHTIELKGMDIHRKELTTFHTSYFITESAPPEPIYYTVILNPYGGSCETTSISVKEQTAIGSLPTPTRTGYYFDGWYSAAVGGARISADTVFTSSRTIYAHWSPIYYTVSYDTQTDSDITYNNVSVQHGYTLEEMPTPSRSGYSFQGWYTDPIGGTQVTDQTAITSNMTLYAHWSANSVTVSFNANGGSVSISEKTVTYKQTYGDLPIPARSGYTFTGWMYDGGVGYSRRINSDSIVESYYGHTLIAQWKETVYKVNGGNIYFDNTTGTITGADSSIISADIPETIDGVTVRAIGDGAFWDCSKMTNISLPNTLKTIGKEAFRRCSQLTAIDFPALLTTIGEGAFRECANLIKITIPASVTQIGDQAFYDCRFLNSVSVNENNNTYSSVDGVLMNKGKTRIIYCPTRLIVVDNRYEIPAGIKEIAAYAFYEVTSIPNITVPHSVTTIDTTSFGSSTIEVEEENQYYSSIDGVLFNKEQTTLLHYPKMRQGSYAVPAGVVKIAEDAFYGSMLSSVTLSESVQVIERSAFSHARLRNISLPESLKRIDDSAFFGCQNLQEVTIPENVETVGDYAFDWCSYLSVVYFQGDVPTLGEFAFGNSNTKKKETVLLFKEWKNGWSGTSYDGYQISPYESRFKTDGGYIYYNVLDGMIINCDSAVSNIVIPAAINGTEITGIAANAFSKCTQATHITIPEGLTDISIRAFSGSSIKTVIYQGTVVQWLEGHPEINYVFDTVSIQCSDKLIPANLAYIGLCSDGIMWHISKDSVLTVDGTGAIEDFASNTAPWNNLRSFVKEIVISQGITRIGSYSFQNLKAEKVSIPGSCTSIGDYAFKGCSLLQAVLIPDGVKEIGKEAFCGCKALSEITIPTSVDTLGYRVFNGSAEDTSVYYAGTTEQWNAMVENRMPSYFDKGVQLYCDGNKLPENTIYMGTAGENVEWYLSVDGTLTITGTGPMISDYEIKVDIDNAGFDDWYYDTGCPWKDYDSLIVKVIIEEGITSVSRNAFLQHEMLESVSIPSTVTKIEEAAFDGCVKLQHITIENGITSIGASAFAGCSSLETVTVPGSVSSLGSYAFHNCTNLTTVIFEEGSLLELPDCAFGSCEFLQNIDLPDSLVDLGCCSFFGCTSLKELRVPRGVKTCTWENIGTNVGIESFYVDASNPYLSSAEGVLFDKDTATLLLYPIEKTAEAYYVPETVTTIAEEAFLGNTYLKTVTIPADIDEIGDRAFLECINLTGVYFAGQCPYYGKSTFKKYVEGSTANYENLPSLVIYYREEAYYEGWNSNPFSEYKKDTWEFEVIEYQVTGGSIYFETISGKIIDADTSVTVVVIPSQIEGWTVSSIGERAFQYCENLTGITLPDSITSIGENAFYACFSLKSIVIPKGVTEISRWAFSCCRKLATITIPRSVKAVQYAAFMECESLNHILYAGTAEEWANIRIVEADDYWPDENNYAMINARTVHYEASEVELYAKESCTYSGMYCPMCNAFAYGSPLDSDIHNFQNYVCTKCDAPQVLRYTLKENGEAVIEGVRVIWSGMEIEIPSYIEGCRVVEISDDAFDNEPIKNIVIPDTVETIGAAFSWCTSLENVIIGSSVKSISYYAFYSCNILEGIWVDPDNQYFSSDDYGVLFNADKSVLWRCPETLSEGYVIADGVREILNSAFKGCSSLTSIIIPDGVTTVGDSAFKGCSSLTSIIIPDSVTTVGDSMFEGCSSLTSIIIPDGVTSIGNYAFWCCSSLTSINIPESVESIGSDAFSYCSSLTSINIPESVTSIGDYAFQGCSSLTSIIIPDGVTTVGYSAFKGCSSLIYSIYDNAKYLGNSINPYVVLVEAASESITSCKVPLDTKVICGSAFSNCSRLESITIPFVGESKKTATDTEQYPFGYIFGSSSYTGGVATKQYYHLYSASSTTYSTYYIPASLKTVIVTGGEILYGAFYGCNNLTSVVLSDSATGVAPSAFYNCSNLTTIVIPDSVEIIGDSAFSGCSSLSTVLYKGTQAQKDEMEVESNNSHLESAAWHYAVTEILRSGKRIYVCGYCNRAFLANGAETVAGNLKQLNITTLPSKLSYIVDDELSLEGISLEGEYADGSKIPVSAAILDNIKADLSTPGRKTVTLTVAGATAEFEIAVHNTGTNIETVTVDPAQYPYPESAHNYGNNANETKTFTYPGAQSLTITFSTQTETESSYDFIYIYDGSGTQIAKYSGTAAAGKTLTVPGDTFNIKLTSDGGVNRYGYSFAGIQANLAELIHDMVAGEITPPTETAQGYTTYHCSYGCGYTEQGDFVDYVEADPIGLVSASLELGSAMSLIFNGNASVLDQYENVYVMFTAPGKDPVKVTKYFTNPDGTYGYAYEGLTILDTNLQVTGTIYGTYDGVEYSGKPQTTSLQAYANWMIAYGDAKTQSVCANLMKYAMAAESYMVESNPGMDATGHLANVLTAQQLAAIDAKAYTDADIDLTTISNAKQGEKVQFYTQQLDMVSRIGLIYIFNIVDTTLTEDQLSFQVSYVNAQGKDTVKEFTMDDLIPTGVKNQYALKFSEFNATQMSEGALLTIYIDGVEHCHWENSIENYCSVAINWSGSTAATVELAKRISLYGDACYAAYGNQ